MIKTNKSLGQNFLQNENILQRIADLLIPDLPVLEIGAGTGNLTKILAQSHKVLAIEKDERFKEILEKIPNVTLQIRDVMEMDKSILPDKYQVVGNLPYYLEKKIIQKFIQQNNPEQQSKGSQIDNPPQKIVFLIQKEVADELCQAKFTLFSLSVKFYCHAKCGFRIKKGSFQPMPKVDGRMIILEDIGYPLPFGLKRQKIEKNFFQLLHFGFSSPRKKLLNNLSVGLKLDKPTLQKLLIRAKIEIAARSEDVELESWLALLNNLQSKLPAGI